MKNISPELLFFAEKLSESHPNKAVLIKNILTHIDKLPKDEYSSEMPYDWSLDGWTKDSIVYSNGIIYLEVKKAGDKYVLTAESHVFDHKKFPFKEKHTFDNVFDAVVFIDFIQEDLDDKYFTETIDYTGKNICFWDLEKLELKKQNKEKKLKNVKIKLTCNCCKKPFTKYLHDSALAFSFCCSEKCLNKMEKKGMEEYKKEFS